MSETNTEKFLRNRGATPEASSHMSRMVSQYRREAMENEVVRGHFKEKGSTGYNLPFGFEDTLKTSAGNVISNNAGFGKFGESASPGVGVGGAAGAGSFRGSGGSLRQVPEIYSPLWLNSNLNLPRDRATINAWSRAFFALNPVVHNAISLHSTYPISKLSIKCKNEKIQAFFEDMIEEIDLMNICVQIAQEYWLLGESFVYAELDERSAKWSRLIIQNPDYIVVKHSVVAGEPIISLRPDENLKRIVNSNRSSDIQQRQRLSQGIIEHVKRGENIPLSNFYASHLARRISPYETRGTGLVTTCFRNLMLFDKLRESKFAQADNLINPLTLIKVGSEGFRPSSADLEGYREVFECHDEETEVLTDQGFKKFNEVIEFAEVADGTYNTPIISSVSPVSNTKIACFNSETDALEYHTPSAAHIYNYDGNMYHFAGEKIDICVTPNHDMWTKKQVTINGKNTWSDWFKIKAFDQASKKGWFKFKANVSDYKVKEIDSVKVGPYDVDIKIYLEFLGYLISEGCVYQNYDNGRYDNSISISQSVSSMAYTKMRSCIAKFASQTDKICHNKIFINDSGYAKNKPTEMWEGRILCKELVSYFKKEIGQNGNVKSIDKIIPRWALSLSKENLLILLNALLDGDGSRGNSKYNNSTKSFRYSTVSKKLADDIYELVFKLGFSPNICISDRLIDGRAVKEYIVLWSNTTYGVEPLVYPNKKETPGKGGGALLEKVSYKGKVWCFTVPTGLFITRRNGKITIQGNSAQYDKDFKVFTHNDVTVEPVGFGGAVMDISGDITQLLKEIYIGLMVPQVLMDGGADVTYANGGVTLDVLRQRYMQFRNMLSIWLRRKIFAPISKINDFYERKDGEKILIVPEIEWNHMSLFDAGDYIQTLLQLSQGTGPDKKVSIQTVYRSLGLDWEDETRKKKVEMIQEAIDAKEKAALDKLPLTELRSLGPDDAIDEPDEGPLPGQDAPGGDMGESGLGGDLGGGLPGMAPPAAESAPLEEPMPEAPPPEGL